ETRGEQPSGQSGGRSVQTLRRKRFGAHATLDAIRAEPFSAQPRRIQAGRGHQAEQPAPPVGPPSARPPSPDRLSPVLMLTVPRGQADTDGEGMVFDAADIVDSPVDRVDVPLEARARLALLDEPADLLIEAAEFGQELLRKELDRVESGRALFSDHEVIRPD